MSKKITLILIFNIFSFVVANSQCSDGRANFTVQGNPYYPCCANFNAVNYGGIWNYGDGSSPSSQGSHCFPSNQLYTISYTYNGCTTTQTYNASGSGCTPITPVCNLQSHYCGDSGYAYFYENNRWEGDLYIFERRTKHIFRDRSLGGSHSNQWSYVMYHFNGWGPATQTAEYSTDTDLTIEEDWLVTYNWNTGEWTNISNRKGIICLTISNSQCANQICTNDCEEGLVGGNEEVLALKKANNEAKKGSIVYPNIMKNASNFDLQLLNESIKKPQNSLEIIEAISKTKPQINGKQVNNSFILYPNPIKSGSDLSVQLLFENDKAGISYIAKVLDITGKIMSSTVINADISNISTKGLSKGVYILAVSNENGEIKQRKKLVVN
jgi:hypothetical protein